MGKTWPGVTRSAGVAFGATAVRIVVARSWALMPVLTPFAASMDTVKPVLNGDELFSTIIGNPSSLIFASSRVRQTKPRPYFAMKLIASGETFSAAMHRSPSFSRSSSSTRMIILPAAMSFRAAVTFSNMAEPRGADRPCGRTGQPLDPPPGRDQ